MGQPASRDIALKSIQDAIKNVADSLKLFTAALRDSPADIGNMSKHLSSADTQLLQAGTK